MPQQSLFARIQHLFERYERHISSIALIGGFIFDNFTLRRIDSLIDIIILTAYLLLIALAIVFINIAEVSRGQKQFFEKLHPWLLIVIQFAFGNLFSGFVVFYSRSAAFAASWPFMLILVGIFLGNEFFKKYYQQVAFHLSIFFVAVFSFAIFFVPIIIGSIAPWVFVLSGILSLIIMAIFTHGLYYLVPARLQSSRKYVYTSVLTIFAIINVFYFTNVLPPIPLSLKDAGVYHFIERSGDGYRLLDEKHPWYDFLSPRKTIHLLAGEPVYVYSSIFAPTKITTTIVHRWEYYNKASQDWQASGLIQFPIHGGRDNGYRGYSMKTSISQGLWRVSMETPRGQLIGRIKFNVDTVETLPPLNSQPAP